MSINMFEVGKVYSIDCVYTNYPMHFEKKYIGQDEDGGHLFGENEEIRVVVHDNGETWVDDMQCWPCDITAM